MWQAVREEREAAAMLGIGQALGHGGFREKALLQAAFQPRFNAVSVVVLTKPFYRGQAFESLSPEDDGTVTLRELLGHFGIAQRHDSLPNRDENGVRADPAPRVGGCVVAGRLRCLFRVFRWTPRGMLGISRRL